MRKKIDYYAVLCRDLGFVGGTRYRLLEMVRRFGIRVDTMMVRSKLLSAPVHLRIKTSDREVFHQVCSEQEYGPLRAARDVRVIVDCGANIGLTSAYLLTMFPAARVIAIEPDAANAALCRRNLAPFGARAQVIEAGIWRAPCRLSATMDRVGNEWGVVVHEDDAGSIEAIDIPSLGLDSIDILKVDIEGSERELFSPSASAWLGRVRHIAIELHNAACVEAFEARLADYEYERVVSGELVICRNLVRKSEDALV